MVQERVGPQWPRMTHDSSSAEPDVPPTTGPIPVEEAPLDPRVIARASLDAARNASLWWTSAGVLLSVLVAFVVGARAGAYTLALVVAACGVVRAVRPSPGPVAISVRSKPIDLVLLFGAAVSLGVLAYSLPPGA